MAVPTNVMFIFWSITINYHCSITFRTEDYLDIHPIFTCTNSLFPVVVKSTSSIGIPNPFVVLLFLVGRPSLFHLHRWPMPSLLERGDVSRALHPGYEHRISVIILHSCSVRYSTDLARGMYPLVMVSPLGKGHAGARLMSMNTEERISTKHAAPPRVVLWSCPPHCS